ncbi:MAG: ABC transporter ATP-binding protein [Candidatus Limnocylindria bacterium]
MADMPRAPFLLEMEHITKRFGQVLADDDISFAVKPGQIHALLGENGAGKSTLMKILYGLVQPDAGALRLEGEPVSIASPHDAVQLGIGMVHQQFMLVPNLTAVENVVLGVQQPKPPLLDLGEARQRIMDLATEYNLGVDPDSLVWQLSVGMQQRLEILKALYREAKLLVLDEPTAVLAPSEVTHLFRVLRKLVAEGRGIVFISHKLSEVKEVSDHITVLRAGRVTGSLPTSEATAAQLSEMMVGRQVSLDRTSAPAAGQDIVLALDGVGCLSDRDTPALRDVSFDVRAGEIVGIAGVDGNGQRELVECIAGLRPVSEGRITINGENPAGVLHNPSLFGFIPEDRHREGLIEDFSVAENVILKSYARSPFTERAFLRWRAIHDHAETQIRRYDIRCSGPSAKARSVSGGNQQKIVVARETQEQPRLLVAAQPTRGLDVGAVESVLDLLREQRDRGAAILLISTELPELLAVSDRVIVLHSGEVMGEVPPTEAFIDRLGQMMMGQRLEAILPRPGSAA